MGLQLFHVATDIINWFLTDFLQIGNIIKNLCTTTLRVKANIEDPKIGFKGKPTVAFILH